MAEEEGAERTHEATPRRREQAREEGQVLSSKDAGIFAAFVVTTGMLAMVPALAPMVLARFAAAFRTVPVADLDDLIAHRLAEAWQIILVASLAVAVPLAAVAIGLQLVLGGLNFAPKAFAFNPSRIDPLAGLGRIFSAQALMEMIKAIVKVALLGAVAILTMQGRLSVFGPLWAASAGGMAGVFADAVMRLVSGMTLGLAVIGAIDLGLQWRRMNKQMMMTLQEVKQESKEQNGSPEVKGRLRALQMEASRNAGRQRRALADVPMATAVITNPTHFAVALRYAPGETRAPMIVAMGKDGMAQEIIQIARRSGVNILPIPPLARALYFTGDIGTTIDEALYTAVAAVLAHVYRLDRGEGTQLPDIDLPPELRFSEFGRREQKG